VVYHSIHRVLLTKSVPASHTILVKAWPEAGLVHEKRTRPTWANVEVETLTASRRRLRTMVQNADGGVRKALQA
jgi:hypothetical protein